MRMRESVTVKRVWTAIVFTDNFSLLVLILQNIAGSRKYCIRANGTTTNSSTTKQTTVLPKNGTVCMHHFSTKLPSRTAWTSRTTRTTRLERRKRKARSRWKQQHGELRPRSNQLLQLSIRTAGATRAGWSCWIAWCSWPARVTWTNGQTRFSWTARSCR